MSPQLYFLNRKADGVIDRNRDIMQNVSVLLHMETHEKQTVPLILMALFTSVSMATDPCIAIDTTDIMLLFLFVVSLNVCEQNNVHLDIELYWMWCWQLMNANSCCVSPVFYPLLSGPSSQLSFVFMWCRWCEGGAGDCQTPGVKNPASFQ